MRQKKNGKPWMHTLLTWTLLIGGIASLLGCTGRLPPKGDDDRACYLGVVTPETLATVQAWVPLAKPGDLLVSRACDDSQTEQTLNEIRRMTREQPRP
jgi:hypothetical protein